MKLRLKIIKDWFIKHKLDIIDCILSSVLCIVWFAFGYFVSEAKYSKDNNAALSTESAALCGFVSDNSFSNDLERVDSVYIILDNVIMGKSSATDKWVSVAPLFLEYDIINNFIYLNYPITTSTTNYKYERVLLTNSNTVYINLACTVVSYSSDMWSVSVGINYLLTDNTFTDSSSYTKTVSEFYNNDNYYGLSNSYTILNDDLSQVGSFVVTQLDGLSMYPSNYYYDYSNIPINKIICEDYDIGYFEGAEAGYNSGYEVGYNYGVTQTLEDLTPMDVLTSNFNGLMKLDIFPGFTIGNALWLSVGIVLFGALMKVFRF